MTVKVCLWFLDLISTHSNNCKVNYKRIKCYYSFDFKFLHVIFGLGTLITKLLEYNYS